MQTLTRLEPASYFSSFWLPQSKPRPFDMAAFQNTSHRVLFTRVSSAKQNALQRTVTAKCADRNIFIADPVAIFRNIWSKSGVPKEYDC
jgi:hypothetical protein